MEKWDGVVLDINATCANLGDTVCSQLLGAHVLSGCDTVSYPFGKGKASVLKTLKAGNFPGLFDVLGEESVTHVDLMAVGQHFFAALYGQPTGTSMIQARYKIMYTRKQAKPLRIMLLPPTDTNFYLQVRRAHLQMLLEKLYFRTACWLSYYKYSIGNSTKTDLPKLGVSAEVISRCEPRDCISVAYWL